MRSTAEQEEIDGEHLEGVYAIVPMQRHSRFAQMTPRVLHRRAAQTSFRDESVDSTIKVFGSIMMSVSLSFEVKDYDISRAYCQETMKKLLYI